jgi:hypothetical protein
LALTLTGRLVFVCLVDDFVADFGLGGVIAVAISPTRSV